MGKWRRCSDCPRGFPTLTKLEAHQKQDHAVQVLSERLHWMVKQLALLEAKERRYWGAKEALESLTPIPPGARELLQAYVNKYSRPWFGIRTELHGIQERIPDLRKGIDQLREEIRQAGYLRPVT